jgi:hypothetical protein
MGLMEEQIFGIVFIIARLDFLAEYGEDCGHFREICGDEGCNEIDHGHNGNLFHALLTNNL